MTTEPLTWALAAAAGALLGLFFFGGLWWTIRKAMASKAPALWFGGSLILRSAGVITGFYFVSGGHWERALACLLGFVAARIVLVRLQRDKAPEASQTSKP